MKRKIDLIDLHVYKFKILSEAKNVLVLTPCMFPQPTEAKQI